MRKFLYKKYRPDNIYNFYGQNIARCFFFYFLKQEKFPSSYIFYGKKGTGKTTFSRIFSKSIMCYRKCKYCKCKSCANFKNNSDFIEVDSASNRKVEDISHIFSNVYYKPMFSKYKIYVLDEVHMLSKHAFNFMLNMLENCPYYVKLILITSEVEKVPSTVISRCFKIFFKAFNDKQIYKFLKYILRTEKIFIRKSLIKEIALFSGGSIRDALVNIDYVRILGNYLSINGIKKNLGLYNRRFSCSIIYSILFDLKKNFYYILKKNINFSLNFSSIYNNILKKVNKIIIYKSTNKIIFNFSKNYEIFSKIKLCSLFNFRKNLVKEIKNISIFPYKEMFLSGLIRLYSLYNNIQDQN
ncbi:DNA polymerase III subunit gamma/tau [Candidatus Vidania fulgoroideorum]